MQVPRSGCTWLLDASWAIAVKGWQMLECFHGISKTQQSAQHERTSCHRLSGFAGARSTGRDRLLQ